MLRMAKIAGALSAACLALSAQAWAQPAAEAYGRLPAVIDVAISPNGERLAVASTDGAAAGFQIVNLNTGQTEHNYQIPSSFFLGGVGWPDDERILLSVSGEARPQVAGGGGRVYRMGTQIIFSLDDRRQRELLVGGLSRAPNEPGFAYGRGRDDSGRYSIFRVNLDNATARRIHSALQDTVGVVIDEHGALLARVDSDSETNRWQLFVYNGEEARMVLEDVSETGEPIGLVGRFPDGRFALVGRHGDDPRERMYALNAANDALEVVFEHERYDITGAIVDPYTQRVIGASWTEDFPRQHFFDPEIEAVAQRVRGLFRNGYGMIVSWSQDRSRFILFGETSGDAGAYYLFEPLAPQANSVRRILRNYPDLSGPEHLGRRQAITYPARDGTRIPAYLTLPPQGDANLPLVLLVHGGPHARDTFGFDPWASFLASRGYAVLQPNFRGSTGYGFAWFDAGRGNWGDGVMQTDVEDGVEALIRSGVADPNRVCIVGASYGGYAAMAGATLTPDRYRCAIAIAGVSDVVRMLDMFAQVRRGGSTSGTSDWWRLSIGDRRGEREHLQAVSPANHAARVRIPMLLMHGDEDTTVPIEQSQIMHERLREAGKDVEFIEFENEGHTFLRVESRTRMLEEMERFLDRHIGQ